MNVSTVIVLAVVAACVCLAIRSFRKKGMCGCKEHCSGSCSSSSCPSCSAADKMAQDMKRAADAADVRS